MAKFAIGGRTYNLVGLSIEQRGEVSPGGLSGEHAEAATAAFNLVERRMILGMAIHHVFGGDAPIEHDPASAMAIHVARGFRSMLRLSLAAGNPELSEQRIDSILAGMSVEEVAGAITVTCQATQDRLEYEVENNLIDIPGNTDLLLRYARLHDVAKVFNGQSPPV